MAQAFGRRGVLAAAGLATLLPGGAGAAAPRLTVWRDPNCGCCGGWIEHMREAGFAVEDNLVPSPAPARRMLGIPADLLSCHAARVGGYAIEGHVPAAAVKRLLAERPPGIRGLAVPAMPIGSPGMEVPGEPPETYEVIAFGAGERREAFMRFRGAEPLPPRP
ncbi:DUF411 domain-containing protein [Crenalkalicoccus roseus]|uniref:DUF411 domain-containing protein n=1 Tax=Crenalkalicoccus roseus TaxID=1485588 RepID=UPI0010805229|nr:DUF411 domain-containing protein [Crenalkalicoccus roseus]